MSWVLKVSLSILLLTGFSSAFANEEKKAEGKEPEKAKEKDFSRDEEFSVISSRVQALEMKAKNAEEDIEKLILEKNSTKDIEKVTEIVKEMKKLHGTYQKSFNDWKKEESVMNLRFPEKFLQNSKAEKKEEAKKEEGKEGEHGDVKDAHGDNKSSHAEAHGEKHPEAALSLDEMEKHVTLGGAVTSSVNKMRSHFKKNDPKAIVSPKKVLKPKKDPKDEKPVPNENEAPGGVLATPVLSK